MLCLTLTEPTIAKDLEVLERNRRYVSLAEQRLDAFCVRYQGSSVFPRKPPPVILTFRRTMKAECS
jgi:hypothetical protein